MVSLSVLSHSAWKPLFAFGYWEWVRAKGKAKGLHVLSELYFKFESLSSYFLCSVSFTLKPLRNR